MPITTIDALRVRALEIKNETTKRANTADRLGSLFEDMIDTFLSLSQPIEVQVANTIIRFDKNFNIGTLESPVIGNIPVELNGFENSLAASNLNTVTIYSVSVNGSLPSFLTGWTNLNLSIPYSTTYGDLNTITAQFNGSSVNYTVVVTADYLSTIETLTTKGLVWRGFERNALVSYMPDLSRNPINGTWSNGGASRLILDSEGNWGTVTQSGQTSKPVIIVPAGGKINIAVPFAVSAWFRGALGLASSSAICIASTDNWNDDDSLGFHLQGVSSTDLRMEFTINRNTSGYTNRRLRSTSLITETWKHVWAEYDGTTMRILINNVVEASQADANVLNQVITPQTASLNFGGKFDTTNSRYYGGGGFIGNVRVYTGYIPTTDERTAIYNHGNAIFNPIV